MLLEEIKKFLLNNVYPVANELDANPRLLYEVFKKYKARGFFRLYVPRQYGGVELSCEQRVSFQEMMGRWGGALSFLQVQCATAAWLIHQSNNAELRTKYLSAIASGASAVGNVTSQMKSVTSPILIGERLSGGYKLSGILPFASGWKFFDELVIGFYTENSQEVFAIISFKEENVRQCHEIQVSPILDTMSMRSMNTVSLSMKNFFIPDERIVVIWPKEHFLNQYKKFPPLAYPLGIALEALSLVNKSMRAICNPCLQEHYQLIEKNLERCRMEVRNFSDEEQVEDLFAQMIGLSWQCVQLAVLLSGGVGLLNSHSAQRIYREITIWLVPRAYPSTINGWLQRSMLK